MGEKEWMDEGFDLKLALLLYRKKIWICALCALAGAVLGGGLYFLVHVVYAPAREYVATSKLYLTFALDDNGDAYQYYNGYTWNDLMGTEPILDKIMEELGNAGYDRQDVRDSITADILSDIRLLTVTVKTHESEKSDRIIRAAENALLRFGQEMPEFDKIEVFDHGMAALAVVEDETVRAVVAGGVIGCLLSLLALAFACVVDDSIYVPSDFEKRYGYPVLGVCFAGDAEVDDTELNEHIELLTDRKESILYLDTDRLPVRLPKEKREEDVCVILRVPFGRGNGKLTDRWIAEAELERLRILGAVITEADRGLYQLYFATFRRRKKS